LAKRVEREQATYDETLTYTTFTDSLKAIQDIPTLETTKRTHDIVELFQKYNHLDHVRRRHQLYRMESAPSFMVRVPGSIHTGKSKKLAAARSSEEPSDPVVVTEPEPSIYVDTPHSEKPMSSVVSSEPLSAKQRAKKQWVRDMLSSTGFTFKNTEECATKRQLADHYLSKQDILRVLDQHPELVETLPPSYKTASKEGLCDILFRE
jgi:hypothetical protein